MKGVPTLLSLLLAVVICINANDVCSDHYDAACLAAMTSLYVNTSAYWFGTTYTCPRGMNGTLLCQNKKPSRTSLLTRLMGDAATDTSGVDFVVNVTYTLTVPGDGSDRVYPGCSKMVAAPLTTPKSFSINPLSSIVYAPFDLREKPEVTWPGEANAFYTVMLYDAGLYFMHSLYINVKGGRLQGGDVIAPYAGPRIPVKRDNPYVWLVMKQTTTLDVANVNKIFASLFDADYSVYMEDVISRLALSSKSYGFNTFRANTDEYAAVYIRNLGFLNVCPVHYGKWLTSYISQRGGLPSLSLPFDLSVSIDVTFTAPAISYWSCDVLYSRGPVNITVDYRNMDLLGAVEARNTPLVNLVPTELRYAPPAITLKDKQYTLLMFDPTPELGHTKQNAYIHWMVVNIRGTDLTSGDEVYKWLLPMTTKLNQLYLFALLEQTTHISTTTPMTYAGTNCRATVKFRCKFRTGDFIRDNNLSLVGLRHLRIIPDTYQQYMSYTVAKFQTKAEACWGSAQTTRPCPTSDKHSTPSAPIVG
ncbi:uncharacterized protein [Haliotis asinina]|uniref:uncharacterized protein n=1 Tax=Haliotis asinina TaxID=109174 RepID=UPI003532079E